MRWVGREPKVDMLTLSFKTRTEGREINKESKRGKGVKEVPRVQKGGQGREEEEERWRAVVITSYSQASFTPLRSKDQE